MIISRIVLVFIIPLCCCQLLRARTVETDEASQIALNFYSLYINSSSSVQAITGVFSLPVEDDPLLYVFNFSDGWVMVPASDAACPVLSYSPDGHFDPDAENPGSESWIGSYLHQLEMIRSEQISGTEQVALLWKRLSQGLYCDYYEGNTVDPLIHTQWNQNCYFNSMCPADTAGPCDHVYTGCVATAMGQIMNYYHYPFHGNGSNSYYDYPYGTISADFASVSYDWTAMANVVIAENEAVAGLLFHCAVSVNTDFGFIGSGAFDPDARDALVSHFNYKSGAQYIERADYTDEEWKQILFAELDERRPVIYGAVGRLYGHTFICDGYQPGNFFHMNWGWGGIHNGYYLLDLLNPGGLNFNLYHDMIVQIEPIDIPLTEVPSGLQVTVSGNTASLQWNAVNTGTDKLLGYNISRDGMVINNIIHTSTVYNDVNLLPGWHTYHVSAVYYGAESVPSDAVAVEIQGSGTVEVLPADITTYRSPGSGNIMFNAPLSLIINTIKITDLLGAEVVRARNTGGKSRIEIPVGPLCRGVYLIMIETPYKRFIRKIILD